MLPNDYQRLAARTETDQRKARQRIAFSTDDPTDVTAVRLNHAVIGLSGEVGELAGAVEKWIYYGQELNKENVVEEIGDCLWYIALACNALGADLGKVMQANIAKLQVRYPDKYTDEDAKVRDLEAEAKARLYATSGGPIGKEIVLPEGGVCNLGRRTKKEVRKAQGSPSGCCEAHANNQACNCLFEATGPDPECRHCRGTGEVSDSWGTITTPCPVCGPGVE